MTAAQKAAEGLAQLARTHCARVVADLGDAGYEGLPDPLVRWFARVTGAEVEESGALLFEFPPALVQADQRVGGELREHGVQEEAGRLFGCRLFARYLHCFLRRIESRYGV